MRKPSRRIVPHYTILVSKARAARARSHSPFSRFRVGSAVLTAGGKIYTGCNIENSSYGLTICAERTALFKAISEGARKFRAIAIASDEAGFTEPCGACRQVIMDLAGDIDVVLSDARGRRKIMRMGELLPHPFGAGNLKRNTRKKK
jgi:cytidine deaminase